ncbi:acyltransferase [Vibrio breoganii]|uniref:acyltransferase n=1 Tax=Vibrio breoganii TaxID=553239 RepID=UPI000C82A4C7|nr:acyltransferase [Vibrio breoganii]PMH15395.1 hypothetical protein BCU74_03025 [Vibrio breoganii]PMM13400.1 hypothetical protein BCT60_12495 [Vibrio breoganii]
MSGKVLFSLFYPLIKTSIKILKLFPLRVLEMMFDVFSLVPTKIGVGIRYITLASMCGSIGKNVYIGRYVIIKGSRDLHIGDNVSIHDSCYIDASGIVSIGSNVSIAHSSSVLSFEHQYSESEIPIKYNELLFKKVTIYDDVWVGCGTRILSGSDVYSRVIIAAGAVVKGKLDSNSIYGGVPCRLIKKI